MLVMYDAIDVTQIPAGAAAVAGYVDGDWPTSAALAGLYPHADRLTIAVQPSGDADALDVENGDATPADAAAWYERQRRRGVARPCIYASAGVMQSGVVPVLGASGIGRGAVRLWSAHYTHIPHICGPLSCGAMSTDADGTQWTDAAMGRDLDQSLLLGDFFGAGPSPSPVPWQEQIMEQLPTLKQGDSGEAVRTVQGLCGARGQAVRIDGSLGPVTVTALRRVQAAAKISPDGVVGPATWAVLLGA
jgi:putative peptidoglycan binding protein